MKKNKQIAIVCNYNLNPNRIGGMDHFFKAYNNQLKEKGANIIWFFAGGKIFDFYENFEISIANGTSVESFFIEHQSKTVPYDVIITHFTSLCSHFYKKFKSFGNPFIIAVDHNPRPFNGFSLQKRLKNKIKGKLYAKYVDCFVGVSKYTVDNIIQDYGEDIKNKTFLVYNGVEINSISQRTKINKGEFIVASHLRDSKGIQDLIEAVKILPQSLKKRIEIDIYGEGPLEKFLKEKVMDYNLEDSINFHGSCSGLSLVFQNYSYLLQPSYMECFSLSILESLAANVPVITTPVGGNPEVIMEGENGFIFQPGDILGLKNILVNVLNGSFVIEGDVSDIIREKFTLQNMVNGHIKLLPYEL